MLDKCNCGREGRYIHLDDKGENISSCNKYSLCKTYDELESLNKKYLADILAVLSYADDVLTFKEYSNPYKDAEYQIKLLIAKYNM